MKNLHLCTEWWIDLSKERWKHSSKKIYECTLCIDCPGLNCWPASHHLWSPVWWVIMIYYLRYINYKARQWHSMQWQSRGTKDDKRTMGCSMWWFVGYRWRSCCLQELRFQQVKHKSPIHFFAKSKQEVWTLMFFSV